MYRGTEANFGFCLSKWFYFSRVGGSAPQGSGDCAFLCTPIGTLVTDGNRESAGNRFRFPDLAKQTKKKHPCVREGVALNRTPGLGRLSLGIGNHHRDFWWRSLRGDAAALLVALSPGGRRLTFQPETLSPKPQPQTLYPGRCPHDGGCIPFP